MKTIVIEITNHCNLSCKYCYEQRHSGEGYIALSVLEDILGGAKGLGFQHISLTGGELTLHPQFHEILKRINEEGFSYSFVTNGWNFAEVYKTISNYRYNLSAITFSIDGAREETHDRIRGKGSYNRLMKAIGICCEKDIPFTLNTVLSKNNHNEIREIIELAESVGSEGIRFCPVMSSPSIKDIDLFLTTEEKKSIAMTLLYQKAMHKIPIVLAPGFYTRELFPCESLRINELNIDWRGNIVFCCHLSGYGEEDYDRQGFGNIHNSDFQEIYDCWREGVAQFREEKLAREREGVLTDNDYFPCEYCLRYFLKKENQREDTYFHHLAFEQSL